MAEAILLSLALGERIKQLQQQKLSAQNTLLESQQRFSRQLITIQDIEMPKISGFDVLAKTKHWAERPIFILLTLFDDQAYLRRALELGALGYLLKDNAESELIDCLHNVAAGKAYITWCF